MYTGGDVDALSFLKLIARRQKSINVLISTWVMAGNDIVYLREMIDTGVITGVDIYVGEIFKTSYGTEWDMLVDLYRDYPGIGHLHKFRNHSKVMAGGATNSRSYARAARTLTPTHVASRQQ